MGNPIQNNSIKKAIRDLERLNCLAGISLNGTIIKLVTPQATNAIKKALSNQFILSHFNFGYSK